MAKQIFIPSTIYHISYMSFTIPVMTRKIGIESTISQMIPPKNILINTGSPQHTAAIITAPKELSWYAETHSVMVHNDKSACKANPNKMPRYFKNNTGWSICWESTIHSRSAFIGNCIAFILLIVPYVFILVKLEFVKAKYAAQVTKGNIIYLTFAVIISLVVAFLYIQLKKIIVILVRKVMSKYK